MGWDLGRAAAAGKLQCCADSKLQFGRFRTQFQELSAGGPARHTVDARNTSRDYTLVGWYVVQELQPVVASDIPQPRCQHRQRQCTLSLLTRDSQSQREHTGHCTREGRARYTAINPFTSPGRQRRHRPCRRSSPAAAVTAPLGLW